MYCFVHTSTLQTTYFVERWSADMFIRIITYFVLNVSILLSILIRYDRYHFE